VLNVRNCDTRFLWSLLALSTENKWVKQNRLIVIEMHTQMHHFNSSFYSWTWIIRIGPLYCGWLVQMFRPCCC